MPKPICVIYFPENFQSAGNVNWIYEYMRYLNGETTEGSIKWGDSKDYWKDYYWFCFYKHDISEPKLVVYFEKEFSEIKYQELKQLITDSLPKQL